MDITRWSIPKSAAAAKLLQLCLTLHDPIDGSPSGSPVPGILQARTLEGVAISFSNTWEWKVKVRSLSHVRVLTTHGLQTTRLLHPWDFPDKSTGVGCHCLLWYQNQIDYILCSWRWRSSIQSAKTRPGADCGSDHELLIAKFRLKSKKVGKTLDHLGMTWIKSLMIIRWKWLIDSRN